LQQAGLFDYRIMSRKPDGDQVVEPCQLDRVYLEFHHLAQRAPNIDQRWVIIVIGSPFPGAGERLDIGLFGRGQFNFDRVQDVTGY